MIHFGTSGWRGIIADDFTFANVRLVSQAISNYLKNCPNAQGQLKAIVGYDTRYLSEDFARASAQVLSANNIKTLLCKGPVPTPAIAYEIMRCKADGAVNFTASHNPPNYNGIKFSSSWGGPALPEATSSIEGYCQKITSVEMKTLAIDEAKEKGFLKEIDPKKQYLKRITELVDLKAIQKSKIKIAVDMLYGTSIGYLDELLSNSKINHCVIHNYRDVLFGGKPPEPSSENLQELKKLVKKNSYNIGIATDGDADRFGIIDSDGKYINPNQTIALLLYHLIKSKSWKGVVARSVMTTSLIDKIAQKFGLEVRETPVGFKYIGEVMVEEGKNFVIGGEESGGLTIRGHVPEKDGILACLLAAETIAVNKKKSLGKILKDIEKLTGPLYSERINFHLSVEEMNNLKERLKDNLPGEFAGIKVKDVITLDGYKFVLKDNSWIGIRLSGTEPVVRLYVETDSIPKMKALLQYSKGFILDV